MYHTSPEELPGRAQFTTPEVRFSSKYAERVAAKHPVTLARRFIHPRPEQKEE
jgi:hypothetical protein